ncbi:MAG: response regulator transcription factor [Anaerolineae bacterium]|nr:MAG: response regulator transcription factor [Anaerolineae bacterium]
MPDITVLLADDHHLLRSGLKLLLEQSGDITVIGEADDGLNAVSLADQLKPDVVLLDLTMPGLSGLEALEMIGKVSPGSRVLVLTMHDDESYLRRALRAGAAGYILKKAADAELLSAVRAVSRGEVYVHSAMTRDLLDGLVPASEVADQSEGDAWEKLSNREQEVLRLVSLGHTNAEVAEQLSLSVKTIETYRSRGMEKLGLRSRAALVKYALGLGLLEE